MAIEVEMQYNSFLPKLMILINGKPVSEYSQLVQFVDEDIWKWKSKILGVLYSELKDDFIIEFTGNDIDIEIMKNVVETNQHCIGFVPNKPAVTTSVQKRLVELNQFLKKHGEIHFDKTILEAYFVVPQKFQEYINEILSIDISNLFCNTRIQISKGYNKNYEAKENSFLFVLMENISDKEELIKKYNSQNPTFLFYKGEKNRLIEINGKGIVYECDFKNLIPLIFDCFLGFPLILALRNCIQSFSNIIGKNNDLFRITTIEPLINIRVQGKMEVGRSNPIKIEYDPPILSPPKVIFRTGNCTVARTDNISVFGIKEGKTELEAYRYGEKKPFQIIDLNIIQRNRIKKIILEEDDLVLGIGDTRTLQKEYFPKDADNTDMIIWKTTDEKIAQIDSKGNLLCKANGVCKILCIAENISAVCTCEVRPYAESLSVDLPNSADKQLHLEPMQEYELEIKIYPQNSIDNKYSIISSDYNVANIVGNKIIAKKKGTATIEIINNSKRKKISFNVKVSKKSFFKKLLG